MTICNVLFKMMSTIVVKIIKIHVYTQGRINSIIGHREKQCNGAHSYITTYRNKTANVDKIKHIFIVWELPKKALKNIPAHHL